MCADMHAIRTVIEGRSEDIDLSLYWLACVYDVMHHKTFRRVHEAPMISQLEHFSILSALRLPQAERYKCASIFVSAPH